MAAADSASKEPQPRRLTDDADAIRSDVASFAATLGFSSPSASSGFDDRDFRKKGPLGRNGGGGKGKGAAVAGDLDSKKGAKLKNEKGRVSGKVNHKENEPRKDDNGLKHDKKSKGRNSGTPKKRWEDRNENVQTSKPSPPAAKWDGKKSGLKSVNWRSDVSNASLLPPDSWHVALADAAESLLPEEASGLAELAQGENWEATVEERKQEGLELLQLAKESHDRSHANDCDARWLATARQSGTTADRIAAMTVLVQDDPVANFRSLDSLLGMTTSKGGKRHSAIAMDALRELFLINLLPDRKLKSLSQQPLHRLSPGDPGRRLLLLWTWEDFLKERYERFLAALEEASKDPLSFLKEKALKSLFELLKGKPEQERRLLAALVNKLGDPERKVASTAGFYLGQLLTAHPNMKRVVVQEVDHFIFRPHVGLRAQYYAAVFLNQIVLSTKGDGPTVARQLTDIYFALFKMVIALSKDEKGRQKGSKEKNHGTTIGKGKGRGSHRTQSKQGDSRKSRDGEEQKGGGDSEVDSRLLAALLTGVNRAFPYLASDDVERVIREHTPSLFRMVHSSSFNLGVQALMLLQHILTAQSAMSARFYRAIYAVLLSPVLSKSSKAAMFLSILFRAMKLDLNSSRIAALAKRLLQVSLQQPPGFACGALMLVSEVMKARPTLWNHVLQPEDQDEDVEHFMDIPESEVHEANRTAAADGGAEAKKREEDDEEEQISGDRIDVGSDLESEDGEEGDGLPHTDTGRKGKRQGTGDTVVNGRHVLSGEGRTRQLLDEALVAGREQTDSTLDDAVKGDGTSSPSGGVRKLQGKRVTWPSPPTYDMRHRDPAFCRAGGACWWELQAMAAHFHPSVAAMARTLLSGTCIAYGGDPLRDLALGVFLDRLAEKKPKAQSKRREGEGEDDDMAVVARGGSLMQPTFKGQQAEAKAAVGRDEFLSLDEKEVAAEDAFFYKFYSMKSTSSVQKQKKGQAEADVDGSDVEDSGEDDHGALVGKGKKSKGTKDDAGDEIVGEDESDDEDIDAFLEGEMVDEEGMSEEEDGFEEGGEEGSDLDFDEADEEQVDEGRQEDRNASKKSKDTERSRADPQGKKTKASKEDVVRFVDFGDEPSESEGEGEEPHEDDDGEATIAKRKKSGRGNVVGAKNKRRRTAGASPFASAEEYAHLL